MLISTHEEVVLEEIDLDLKEFAQRLVGEDIGDDIFSFVSKALTLYLNMHPEASNVKVTCDRSNNPESSTDLGKFRFDSSFTIGPTEVTMVTQIVPDEICANISNAIMYVTALDSAQTDVDCTPFLEEMREIIRLEDERNGNLNEMPATLAATLGFIC
jgi:hypothetical protein